MSVYSLKKTQFIPISLDAAWDFFSHPKNLAVMTPAYLNLKFTNELYGEEMYPGQVMTYNVRPVLGIPMFWMTEITHVVPKKFFVDEQRFGPYAMWHHQHHFEEVEGGVLMTDLIHYKAPLGFLGDIAVALFIKKQLEGIFDFRKKKVEELFPSTANKAQKPTTDLVNNLICSRFLGLGFFKEIFGSAELTLLHHDLAHLQIGQC